MPRQIITLACADCSSRNYTNTKNKTTNREKMKLKKYCWKCQKHTVHQETR